MIFNNSFLNEKNGKYKMLFKFYNSLVEKKKFKLLLIFSTALDVLLFLADLY